MTTNRPSLHSCNRCPGSEQTRCNEFWSEWCNWLKPYVMSWIFTEGLAIWQGQESDIAEDVLQETSIRILKYIRRITASNDRAIGSLENFSLTVAHNYLRDLVRRQARLVRLNNVHTPSGYEKSDDGNLTDLSEIALDQLISRDLLAMLARIITDFPAMQRQAILTDLAKYADFDEEAGMLAAIFLELGINLREYWRTLPRDPTERNRHASLLSVAYKRLRQAFYAEAQLAA